MFKVESPAGLRAIRDVKETMGMVSMDYDNDDRRSGGLTREYVLPDGTEMTVAGERFRPPELLFYPETQEYFDCKINLGLHHRIVQAVRGCSEAIQVRTCNRIYVYTHTYMCTHMLTYV